jgi:hypothetical protein
MRKKPLLAVVGAACSALLLVTTTPASATPKVPSPRLVSDALAAPFNIAFKGRGTYVADGGLNQVVRVRADGTLHTVVADAPGTSGLAFSKGGVRMAFTTIESSGPPPGQITASGLHIYGPGGSQVFADTLAFENANNPDQDIEYGVQGAASQSCKDALAEATGVPATYKGLVDSHAYSVASYKNKWVVADAGANALLWVTNSGSISTLAVLPSQPLTITAAMATAMQLPQCAGITYRFEAVPTDVEVRGDYLYVTTLPGGPEDPSLGARGKVYRVNPRTGDVKEIASGLLGATNLAFKGGKIYVAELFGGQISVIRHGKPSKYMDLPGVVAVETDPHGTLWAATLGNEDPPAPGTLVKIVRVRANS